MLHLKCIVLFRIDNINMAGYCHARFRCDKMKRQFRALIAPEVSGHYFHVGAQHKVWWRTSELLFLSRSAVISSTVAVWYLGDCEPQREERYSKKRHHLPLAYLSICIHI